MIQTKENTFQKYSEYKDSGAPWIGEIPSHWETERGKWLFVKNERPVRSFDKIVTCFRDGEVTLRSNRRTDGFTNAIKEHGYQGIRKGDLVIHAMDAFAGAIGVSDSDGKSTPVYSACTERFKNSVNQYYYAYFLRNLALNGVIVSLAKGIRERSTDFRFNDFGELTLTFPPLSEQTAIAHFLDEKTSKIDQAIAQKEKMIELLKERKQIIIQNAVTGQLKMDNGQWIMRPKSEMKDSGVEWIGEIPEHWGIKKTKHFGTIKSGEGISNSDLKTEGNYEVFGGNGLMGYSDRYNVDGVQIIIGRVGALCGNVRLSLEKRFVSDNALIYSPSKSSDYKYLAEILTAADLNKLNTSSAQPLITGTKVMNQYFPYPSAKEREKILSFIEAQSAKIDQAILLQQTQIEKLKEYKATLIDSAVTGKIKVN